MKKTSLLKTMFLLCSLIVGSSAWGATKTEGFETKATASNYQGTVTIAANESDCNIAWSIYYGCVSTNDKIAGSHSAQMRWYSGDTHKDNYGYVMTTTSVDGLSNVSFKARVSDVNIKMDVSYSSDGSNWTVHATQGTALTFKAKNTAYDFSVDVPSGSKYIKIGISSSSSGQASGSKLIVDNVVFTYTSSLTPATWSVSPASATVDVDESTVLDLSTNYDGTLTFASNDEDVATVSYNSSTKKITVTGVAPGSTTISATGAATATYEAISKSITVNVNHPEIASNVTDEMGPLGYSFFGLTPSGSNTYAEVDLEAEKTDAYGVSITIVRNGNSNSKPRFDTNYWRFYNGNTLTVEAPANSYITKIVFVEPETGKAWTGSMTANYGDYVSFAKAWYATTTGTTSVTLTNDNTKRIGKLQVYLNRSTVPVTVTVAEYATFVSPYNLNFSTTGITVYTATDEETQVQLNEVVSGQIPANTPVVLYKAGADGTAINVPVIATADALAGTNDLRVSTGTDVANMYVLSKKNSKVGFREWSGTSDLSAGKVYLLGKASYGAREFIGFDNEVTAIEAVKAQNVEKGQFFNLAGQRVAQPTRGLYIVNGKKVIIK